jgi:tetratricopeptide (TPR) repeat protein
MITFMLVSTVFEEAPYENELKLYYRAKNVAPNNVFAWMSYGVKLAEMKRFPEAEAAYRRAVEITGDSGDRDWLIHQNLGTLLVEVGRYDEAEHQFTISLRGNARYAKTYIQYAVLRVRQNRWQEASDKMQIALALDPSNPELHYMQSLIYHQLGNSPEEKRELLRVLQLDPHHKSAHARLDEMSQKQQKK